MKGFAITLVSLSLIMLLVVFAGSLRNNYLSMERALLKPQPLIYASFIFESVAQDVNSIAGPEMEVLHSNDSRTIYLADTLPGANLSDILSEYENYLEGEFANKTHAAIDANLTNLSSGKVSVLIDEKYIYERDSPNEEALFSATGDTEALSYSINIAIDKERQNLTLFNFTESGDLNVSLIYTDLNGTISESGKLLSSDFNRMEVIFADGGSFYLDIGRKSGSDGSLWMRVDNATAIFEFDALLPPIESSEKKGFTYDATLDYVQGDIHLSRLIGS
jgi:hypothetical protein